MTGKITVLIAMQAEAAPLIEHYGLVPSPLRRHPRLPPRAFVGRIGTKQELELSVVHCGVCPRFGVDAIGTQPATLAAHLAIEEFCPDLLISAGTCGGFSSRGAAIGDVYLAHRRVVYHDRRIAIPGFDVYGEGHFTPIDLEQTANRLGLKSGILSTGNSLDMPQLDRASMDMHAAVIKDMEGAAVAWVAEMHGVPFTAIKAVTDLVDGDRPTSEEFLEHLSFASTRLGSSLALVLDDMSAQYGRTRNAT